MPIYLLGEEIAFPPVEAAEDGLLAIGGDLSPERLIRAYAEGIFPWYEEGIPILWHAPDPRFVLTPDRLQVSRSLSKTIRSGRFRVTMDAAFREVVGACATVPRPDQDGTWITSDMQEAYARLHDLGLAHSVEAWLGEDLAGGLYGVSLGAAFFGESMFTRLPDASKVAFVALIDQLDHWGIRLIDCQVHTDHLARFGAEPWPRARFMRALRKAIRRPTRRGAWTFDEPDRTGAGSRGSGPSDRR